jgi:hypothetical protein
MRPSAVSQHEVGVEVPVVYTRASRPCAASILVALQHEPLV